MSCTRILNPADLLPPSARRIPRPSRGDGWNILADIEVFIFAVEAELEVMDRERVGVHRRGRKPDRSLRRLMQQNMGKQGLCVNVKDPRGLELLHKRFYQLSRHGRLG
jgi:hypothetical protein